MPSNKGIRVKENIQIVPPREEIQQQSQIQRQPQPQQYEWVQVGKRGKIKRQEEQRKKQIKTAMRKEKRRLPKTSAVSIKGSSSDFSYAEALKRARSEISLKDLEIQSPKIRKGMSGSTIIEISGPDSTEKADRLATEMQKLLKGEALVTRPNIRGELRIFGMDESISADEVREAVAKEGECKSEEVKVGKIGRTRTDSGVVWIQCSKKSAVMIADKQRIQIGSTTVRIELLRARPIQCHKCWKIGHVREKCKSDKDYCC